MKIFFHHFTLVILFCSFSFTSIAKELKLNENEQEQYHLQLQQQHKKMINKIKVKLKKYDKETFEEFAFLGFSYCLDELLPYHGSMGNMYSNGFNGKSELFPRMIDIDDLQKELSDFHKKNFKYKTFNGYFNAVNQCQSVYHIKNKNLRKTYLQIINNPSYQENWNFDY